MIRRGFRSKMAVLRQRVDGQDVTKPPGMEVNRSTAQTDQPRRRTHVWQMHEKASLAYVHGHVRCRRFLELFGFRGRFSGKGGGGAPQSELPSSSRRRRHLKQKQGHGGVTFSGTKKEMML